jgi:hypothetical protein
MTIFEKIVKHSFEKNYVKIKCDVGKKSYKICHGYILNYSSEFILLIENDNFIFDGYAVFLISSIVKIRNNEFDQHIDYIMAAENKKREIQISYPINLESWQTILKSINDAALYCSIENENENNFFFKIGEIKKINQKSLSILNFDPEGFLDKEPTKIKYKEISKITFDDNYTSIMSKYLQQR